MAAVSHGLRAAWNTNSECKWINASQMLEKNVRVVIGDVMVMSSFQNLLKRVGMYYIYVED